MRLRNMHDFIPNVDALSKRSSTRDTTGEITIVILLDTTAGNINVKLFHPPVDNMANMFFPDNVAKIVSHCWGLNDAKPK